jgi:hypothetical protein
MTEAICRVCGKETDYSADMHPSVQKWCSLDCAIRPDPIPVECLGFPSGFGILHDVEVYNAPE